MELIPCDPAQPDKCQVVTAARIKEFMMKLGVWDMKDKGVVKIIADHAIAGGLGQYLRAVGWQNTENSIYVMLKLSEARVLIIYHFWLESTTMRYHIQINYR